MCTDYQVILVGLCEHGHMFSLNENADLISEPVCVALGSNNKQYTSLHHRSLGA